MREKMGSGNKSIARGSSRLLVVLITLSSFVSKGLAQIRDAPVCGPAGAISADCQSAIDQVDVGKTYTGSTNAQIYCGTCGIFVDTACSGESCMITGDKLKADMQKVLDNCQGSGWYIDTSGQGTNNSMSKYEVCMYGTCTSPSGCGDGLKKRQSPAPGVQCVSGPETPAGPYHDLANTIPDGNIGLPAIYRGQAGGIYVYENKRSDGIDGTTLRNAVNNDINLCTNPSGGIGSIQDTANPNYIFEAGKTCGENGEGNAGCAAGG